MKDRDQQAMWNAYSKPKQLNESGGYSPGRVAGSSIPFPDGRGEHGDAVKPTGWEGEGYGEMDIEELAGLRLADKVEALNAMVRTAPMDEQDEYELNRKLFAALELMHDSFLRANQDKDKPEDPNNPLNSLEPDQ